jgi:hypothetical protein
MPYRNDLNSKSQKIAKTSSSTVTTKNCKKEISSYAKFVQGNGLVRNVHIGAPKTAKELSIEAEKRRKREQEEERKRKRDEEAAEKVI